MAGLSPRIVIACAIPTFLALVSFVWFRKKKKSPSNIQHSLDSLGEDENTLDNISSFQFTEEPSDSEGKLDHSDSRHPLDHHKADSLDVISELSEVICGEQEETKMQLKELSAGNESKSPDDSNEQAELSSNDPTEVLNQTSILEDTVCNNMKDKLNFGYSSSLKKFKDHESESRCEIESCTGGKIENVPLSSPTDNDSQRPPMSPQNKVSLVQPEDSSSSMASVGVDAEIHHDENSISEQVNRTTLVYLNPGSTNMGVDTLQKYGVAEIAVVNSPGVLTSSCSANKTGVQEKVAIDPVPALVRDPEIQLIESKSQSQMTDLGTLGECRKPEERMEEPSEHGSTENQQSHEKGEPESKVKGTEDPRVHGGEQYHFDSANNSLTDNVTESPGQSTYSDAQSEGSSDSGKGGSDSQLGSESSNVAYVEDGAAIYEFELPQDLCGRLIGRQGKHITFIKTQSHANVFLKRHPFTPDMKICAVEGSPAEINAALNLIRKRFPISRYPSVTMVELNAPISYTCIVPHALQLHLPEGVTCDVILSCLINAGHFFLQQPTHPTFTSLSRLDQDMNMVYSMSDPPPLPPNFSLGVICAAPQIGGWFRAAVVSIHENCEECDVKFMDYGGYATVPISSLRQIKHDFMTLPFQAKECYLANVCPIDEEAGWSFEACATFEELAQGQILQALVVGYAEDGVPYVHLYRTQGASTVFINRELASRGLAAWVDHQ